MDNQRDEKECWVAKVEHVFEERRWDAISGGLISNNLPYQESNLTKTKLLE
jgi:hypothetical protein